MSVFKADRIFRTNTIQVEAPPEKVFPLLCPVREYDWVEPWKCEMIYTDSGFVEDLTPCEARVPVGRRCGHRPIPRPFR
jgi:hypothetical protein